MVPACLLLLHIFAFLPASAGSTPAFPADGSPESLREDFDDLDNWWHLKFRSIDKYTRYSVERPDGNGVLRIEADHSASSLIWNREFPIREYPVIRWRWKVERLPEHADLRKKSTDDFAVRVYVWFKFDPEKSSLLKRSKYGAAKFILGRYPADSALCYVWANRSYDRDVFVGAYAEDTRIILLKQGPKELGRWVDERVDALADYRRTFGSEPPVTAGIAVMGDADNTGDRTLSFLDFIEVDKRGE